VNHAPSFVKGADQLILEDAGLQTVPCWATAISAGPPTNAGQTLNFIVSNNNNALFVAQPAVASNGALTYTPAAHMNARHVTCKLHDDGGTAMAAAIRARRRPSRSRSSAVNDAPSFIKGADQVTLEDAGAQTVAGWRPQSVPAADERAGAQLLRQQRQQRAVPRNRAVAANGS